MLETGQPAAALAAYEQGIEHLQAVYDRAPQFGHCRLLLSNSYAGLARVYRTLDQPAQAAGAALERRKLWPGEPIKLYDVACDLALCVPLMAKGKSTLGAEEQAERQKWIDQTIEVLREAVTAGFKDFDHMRTDPDLDAIREHAEFQGLFPKM